MRILVFTPFSHPNGAEKMLWYLLKNADRRQFTFSLYTNFRGALIDELPDDISFHLPPMPVPIAPEPTRNRLLMLRIRNKLQYWITGKYPVVAPPKNYIEKLHEAFKPDLWYINTIHMGEVAALATRLKIPYVVHFHDMLYLYRHISYQHLQTIIGHASLLIGCAECVCEKLRIMGGQRIALQYECTEVQQITRRETRVERLRHKFDIRPGTFVWVMPGAIDIRKGTDLIPRIGRILGDRVVIICLGESGEGFRFYVEQEIKYFQLPNVFIEGFQTEEYHDYLSLADGILLTSREDPFPLVMIEGAAAGKPIVSFNSGGVSEFVEEGMGVVVDSCNVEDLVSAMERVMKGEVFIDPGKSIRRAAGFDAAVQTRKWEQLMKAHFEDTKMS